MLDEIINRFRNLGPDQQKKFMDFIIARTDRLPAQEDPDTLEPHSAETGKAVPTELPIHE